jgi:hypothetical protein
MSTSSVWIGNINRYLPPSEIRRALITMLTPEFGFVQPYVPLPDPVTQAGIRNIQNRGFAFVKFETVEQAQFFMDHYLEFRLPQNCIQKGVDTFTVGTSNRSEAGGQGLRKTPDLPSGPGSSSTPPLPGASGTSGTSGGSFSDPFMQPSSMEFSSFHHPHSRHGGTSSSSMFPSHATRAHEFVPPSGFGSALLSPIQAHKKSSSAFSPDRTQPMDSFDRFIMTRGPTFGATTMPGIYEDSSLTPISSAATLPNLPTFGSTGRLEFIGSDHSMPLPSNSEEESGISGTGFGFGLLDDSCVSGGGSDDCGEMDETHEEIGLSLIHEEEHGGAGEEEEEEGMGMRQEETPESSPGDLASRLSKAAYILENMQSFSQDEVMKALTIVRSVSQRLETMPSSSSQGQGMASMSGMMKRSPLDHHYHHHSMSGWEGGSGGGEFIREIVDRPFEEDLHPLTRDFYSHQ